MRLYLCALALALLLAPVASAQTLEGTIMLPDTLGPLNGPYHLAWDSDSAHLRLYIGSEKGDVIVADASNYRRLARIPVSPVYALCYVPRYGKLYAANRYKDSVTVIDGMTNQVIKHIKVPSRPGVLVYNHLNDRLYCGGISIAVIDCAQDTVVRTIAAPAVTFAFDSIQNKLYAGASGGLTAIDCEQDSIVVVVNRVRAATQTLCYNPTAQKIYAILRDTLFAVDTRSDSVVGELTFTGLISPIACDPQANRVYCWSTYPRYFLHAVDCAGDTSIYEKTFSYVPLGLACDPVRNKVIFTIYWGAFILDGSTGSFIARAAVYGEHPVPLYSPELDRIFCVPDSDALSALDCASDSVAGGVPLTFWPYRFCLDTALNKLYFSGGVRAIGVADCSRNVVTSYMWACDEPEVMVHNPARNKLYCGSRGDSSVVVFDCTADTVLKSIYAGGHVLSMYWLPGRDKLYAFTMHPSGTGYSVAVIDCAADTVLSRIVLPPYFPERQLLVPESDRLWSLHSFGFTVIDTKHDMVVVDTEMTRGWTDVEAACSAPEVRKVYCAGRDDLYVIDMDSTANIESLMGSQLLFQHLHYAAQAHKLYWAGRNDIGIPDSVYVVDTQTDSVVAGFLGSSSTVGMCTDRTGVYVYSAGSTDDEFLTIDTRTDSVVHRIGVPRDLQGLALNQLTHRIYCYPYWEESSGIPVIYDSAGVGLCEVEVEPAGGPPCATLVSRSRPLWNAVPATLYNATGRRAVTLHLGPNDIGHLAPGVYFVREEPRATSHELQAVRKVVIAR